MKMLKENDDQPIDLYWRSLILYGANVATYKFSLAKSLLEFATSGKSLLSLDEIALPFSKNMCEHIKTGKMQCTNNVSSYIDACSAFNREAITLDMLIEETKTTGFRYVLDAFHALNGGQIKEKFYVIQGSGKKRQIELTDNLFKLAQSLQFANLEPEVNARWILIEDTWTFNNGKVLSPVLFDIDTKKLYIEDRTTYRRDLTAAKYALIGYQKGKCFYCLTDIYINEESKSEVDHFIPFTLRYKTNLNLNAVWNLVISCEQCNRGIGIGKFAAIPKMKYLERLNKRNNYLINSHHPLSNTLISQTGSNDTVRGKFLMDVYTFALNNIKEVWEAYLEFDCNF